MPEPSSPVPANPLKPLAQPIELEPGFRAEAFRALRHRNFRLFFLGQFVSLIGTWMQSAAQGWLVLRLSDSPLMLGVVSFARFVPILIVSLFAGVVVDHVDRRRLIVLTQNILMFTAFILAAITWARVVRVEHVIMLAAIGGLVGAFDMPGRQAFLVEMVGKEDLPNAIALNSMLVNGARAIGPAIAGLLLLWAGEAGCFFLNGVSYLAVIWSLLAMDLPVRDAPQRGVAMLRRLREGLAYAWRHRPTLNLLVMVAIVAGFSIQHAVLMPVFARDILHGGPRGYGFLLAAQGLGAACGALAVASRSTATPKLRQNLVAGLFSLALAITVFGASPWMALSLGAQLFVGAGQMSYMATANTVLQLSVSDDLRGRVMSMYTLSFIGMAPIGSLGIGYIGEHLSPQIAVMLAGLVALGCGVYLLTKLSTVTAIEPAGVAEALAAAAEPAAE